MKKTVSIREPYTTNYPEIPKWLARIETARCTGHCCDPIMLGWSPGELKRKAAAGQLYPTDRVLPEILVWLRWRPPSQGGWSNTGNHEYSCIHFDTEHRICLIHDQPRPRMCEEHPYYTWGKECDHPGCTRRTAPIGERARRVILGID